QVFFLNKKTIVLPTFVRNKNMAATKQAWVFLIMGILSLVAAWTTLLSSGSTAPLRSPWEVVPLRFLALLGVATIAVFLLSQNKRTTRYAAILGFFTVATSLFVAAAVYRLGYGFDPFIHEAAMREIATHGVVFPKTPYYLGAYTLLVSLHRMSGIALHTLTVFVGPLLGTIALADAGITVAALVGWGAPIAILLALFSPLGHFIQTTPQGIADAFALLATSTALRSAGGQKKWILPYSLAVAAMTAHPLAGIPALGIVTLIHTWTTLRQKTRSLVATGITAALLTFPITAFLLQSPIATQISFSGLRLRVWDFLAALLHATTVATFSPWRTLLYNGRILFPFLFVAMILFVVFRRNAMATQRVMALGAAATGIGGAFLALFVRLADVPAYEQFIFPLRFVSLAALFLLPLFLEGATRIVQKVSQQKVGLLFIGGILALSIPAAIYLAYPRIDPEDRSGGRSISSGTINAVGRIHDEHPQNAIVLANQTAAAAEIWQYGFTRYVNGEFYYSHPSGAPHLYNYYLEAVNQGPSSDVMRRAMDAYHADTAYLILHDYWKNYPALRKQALATADRVIDLSSEGVMIFVYTNK
nr:hypothetical protein [Patescibacteria group bacterium]